MTEAGWGERKARDRDAGRRLAQRWTVFAALVAIGGPRFVAGFLDGFTGRPRHPAPSALEAALTELALAVVLTVGGTYVWRRLDEVQRYGSLTVAAAIGAAAVIARPLFLGMQPLLGLADPEAAAWYAALAAGAIVAIGRRRRWS